MIAIEQLSLMAAEDALRFSQAFQIAINEGDDRGILVALLGMTACHRVIHLASLPNVAHVIAFWSQVRNGRIVFTPTELQGLLERGDR